MTSTAVHELPPEGPPDPAVLERARALLQEGAIVAIPTETVYGLAARADLPAALAALRELKGSDPDRPFTWHLADESVLVGDRDGVELRAVAERLAERYWPGPLTLVLRGVGAAGAALARDGWVGCRVPAHEGCRALLAACPFPIAATSANLADAPPATDAETARRSFEGRIPLLLDGGSARLAEASTVLCLGRGRFEIAREGLIDAADLRRAGGLSILFVCTGNTCRSPMAATLAEALLRERIGAEDLGHFGFEVASAGVFAGVGAPASAHAVELLAAEGLDLSAHRSSPALPARIRDADRVYCLTASHRDALLGNLPPGAGAHVELLDPEGRDIPDPIGGDLDVYRACADRIRTALEERVTAWV